MSADLTPKDIERAKFAFDIYDFEGKSRMDLFYLGDCLRGLNTNPTLKQIEELGGTSKKGEKFLSLEEFYPIYTKVKKSLDMGSFEDFIECLKLYDKQENGTMLLGELEHILLSLGEKLEREEVDLLIKECCEAEDDDGFIPYEAFLKRICAGPHPEMFEDW
ncbi:myosin light chain 1 isoform X2 [Lepeophtheirus salmonis]|uniref:Myosin light chain alkali n=1 Tax=Lepeophtheirus salmonis TaxID=72036 RepID=D3PIM3_LEPSM|nr:myosin light chain 1-like isoform X3 [Lepeophtheirus salmonis]ADD38409.1 Myosin light chain alkali [Lepeophtheirus salmonis]